MQVWNLQWYIACCLEWFVETWLLRGICDTSRRASKPQTANTIFKILILEVSVALLGKVWILVRILSSWNSWYLPTRARKTMASNTDSNCSEFIAIWQGKGTLGTSSLWIMWFLFISSYPGPYEYAGLQNTYQCFCGDSLELAERYGRRDDSECNAQCPGDQNQYCGGIWRNSIYRIYVG